MKRNSNLEMLRIVAMLMIIAHHFTLKSGALLETYGVNQIITIILYIGGKVGSNIFVIIGAYFLIDARSNISRAIKIWGGTLFYSIAIGIPHIALTHNLEVEDIKLLFPVFGEEYWFSSCYISLLMISPLLNALISNVKQELYKYGVIILTVLMSVGPTILPWKTENYINNLLWFIYLYLLIGYLKKYHFFLSIKRNRIIFWTSYCMIFISVYIFMRWSVTRDNFDRIIMFANEFSILVLASSISLFCIFVLKESKWNKCINEIAGTTFGIYLIHMHPMIKDSFWENIFKCSAWMESSFYAIFSIISIGLVFIGGFLIEETRKMICKWLGQYMGLNKGVIQYINDKCFNENRKAG